MPRIVQLSLVWLVVAALYVLLSVQEGFAIPTNGCGPAGSLPCSVPEPGSLSLLVTGVAATLYIFRRRK